MRFYFRTRHALVAVLIAVCVETTLLALMRVFAINRPSGLLLFAPAVPLQVVAVAVLTLALSGRSEQFEFAGARNLRLLRLLNVGILAGAGAVLAFTLCSVAPLLGFTDSGTVGQWAALRAFTGLLGAALIAAAFLDMRLAALCSAPLVLIPFAFDTRTLPAGSVIGFVLADADDAAASVTAIALLLGGVILYTLIYSERSSPSTNRRALLDARARMRRQP